jgi:hypothetical protein
LRGFPTGDGAQRLGGLESASSEMNGYPKIFNIEMDPGEQLNVAFLFPWVPDPALRAVLEYERSVKPHPQSARAECDSISRRRMSGDRRKKTRQAARRQTIATRPR